MWYQMALAHRTSLIIRCSKEDAVRIRKEAASEHRSLSGYVLRMLERSMWVEERATKGFTEPLLSVQARRIKIARRKGRRVAVHVRCTVEEAAKTREFAARRHLSISDFVVFSLRRHWRATELLPRAEG